MPGADVAWRTTAVSSEARRVSWLRRRPIHRGLLEGRALGPFVMGNGPEMDFSAPPDAHGHAGVLTPEDAFVAAANTCVMMMFLWACERFKLDLVNYRCRAEGTKKIELDRTEIFTHLRFWPEIIVRAGWEERQH